MAYYLAVDTNDEDYEALKIKKSGYFGLKNNEAAQVYECTLEEIDSYTTKFQDQDKLMCCLTSERILSNDRFGKPLAIIYTNGVEVRKVSEDILYSNVKKYLKQPELVLEYIKQKISEENIHFFRTFIQTLPETSMIKYLITTLASAMEEKNQYDSKPLLVRLIDNPRSIIDDKLIDNIANALVYKCYIDEHGELVTTDVIDTERLHNTLSFISKYENGLILHKSEHKRTKEKPQ